MTDDLLEEYAPEIPDGYVRMNWFQGFGRVVGPMYERVNADKTYTRAFLVGEPHTNGMKNCHGGMLMAFADMAGISIAVLPPSYYKIFDKSGVEPVIEHFQASRGQFKWRRVIRKAKRVGKAVAIVAALVAAWLVFDQVYGP